MILKYDKGTITKHLKKLNQISERAVSNINVTKSSLKFDKHSFEAMYKVEKTKINNNN